MYKITVLLEHPVDPAEFESYLKNTHLPLVYEMPGVSRIELTKFEKSADGSKPEFYRMAELYFGSKSEMEETMGSPEGQATINDLQNLTASRVKIILGTVE